MKRVAFLTSLTIIYFVAGKIGLSLAFLNPSASAVWPPSGIALAALLVFGYSVWPSIYVGAFLVNLTTAGTVTTSLGIATGNTLEALSAAYLVIRFANGRMAFDHTPDILKFAGLAALVSTALSATLGVTVLAMQGFVHWPEYPMVWLTWWLGDAAGILVVAPFLIHWSNTPPQRWSMPKILEAASLCLALLLVTQAIFGDISFLGSMGYPVQYLCLPLLIWIALRFNPPETATAILLASTVATWGTLRGTGPFAREDANHSLLLLQSFLGIMSAMILVLATEVSKRRQMEERLRHLAISDPLTGLTNYRQLVYVIENEITRVLRTGRTFTILFLDVDNLKTINDRHGHLVGSRALIRVADALRLCSRAMDTAARFGGDEFVLVLPETDEAGARLAAQRITQHLRTDGHLPPVSVSVGFAQYPVHGKTVESLFGAADRLLYQEKAKAPRPVKQ